MNSSVSTVAASILFSDTFRQHFRLQNTIAEPVSISGFGFWTGEDAEVEFRPAKPHSGIVFVRTDLEGNPRIPALVRFREEKPRQTSLSNGSARVDMTEHLLSALRALQIDNCEVRINKSEVPGLDGSAMPFFSVLKSAGIIQQPAVRLIRLITRSFRVGTAEQFLNIMPNRSGNNCYAFSLIPDENYPLKPERFELDLSTETYENEVCSSRTFLAKHEADFLLQQGLCKRVTPKDVLVLTPEGPLDNEYRYENECSRHKVLDMVGDFSLSNCDWVGTFESSRGGHALNAECVKQLLENTLLIDETFIPPKSEILLQKQEMLKKAA
ncbi:UDP-3-O-acyl-N-acetylglucosamine deacetylase [Planctomycetales bacterium]|nr:UDP-3-O-acyl-N-acetylglucosamine deacetylase [Planctomycetales bacterium]